MRTGAGQITDERRAKGLPDAETRRPAPYVSPHTITLEAVLKGLEESELLLHGGGRERKARSDLILMHRDSTSYPIHYAERTTSKESQKVLHVPTYSHVRAESPCRIHGGLSHEDSGRVVQGIVARRQVGAEHRGDADFPTVAAFGE